MSGGMAEKIYIGIDFWLPHSTNSVSNLKNLPQDVTKIAAHKVKPHILI